MSLIQIGIGRVENFFVQGIDWVCRPEEWVDVIKFDNTLGVLDTAGESSIA